MQKIMQMLAELGINTVPVTVAAIEAVLGVILLKEVIWAKISNSKRKKSRVNAAIEEFSSSDDKNTVMAVNVDDYGVVFAAENIQKVTGISEADLRKDVMCVTRLFSEKQEAEFKRKYNEWDAKEPMSFTYQMGSKSMRLMIMRTDNEKYDMWIWSDVTEECNDIAELKDRLAKAEYESQFKTNFLSRMSHEIRTPMNGIMGMITLAKQHTGEKEQMEYYLNKTETLSQHLLSLINDILDMSRIEAGKIELEEKAFDIFAMGDKINDMFKKTVTAKGVDFRVEFKDFENQYMVGDELRLSQIIINFLSNAVKFTSEGEVTVTFRQLMSDDNMVNFMVRVHDTGIGMEPEFIERIFKPFEQESVQSAIKYGGTGLGMAISDQLVKIMGGEIFVESYPGRGTDFTVYLRLPSADDAAIKTDIDESDDYSLEGKRILLAEDNEINVEIAVGVLEEMEGAKVEVAKDGGCAVDMFEKSEPGYYDVILMDIQMPVMDGRTATKKIRELPRKDATTIPIFAMSADAFVEDERKSVEAGMNGHFKKPIDFDDMCRRLGSYLNERS